MLKAMKTTLTAIFIGGDRDGTTVELKGPHPAVISTLAGATDGGLLLADRIVFRYTLVSHGPLHYVTKYQQQFEQSKLGGPPTG